MSRPPDSASGIDVPIDRPQAGGYNVKSSANATALDLQQGKSALIFSLVASWCNGSTRDSGSLCLGSNPSEAATLVHEGNGHRQTSIDIVKWYDYGMTLYGIRGQRCAGAVALLAGRFQ